VENCGWWSTGNINSYTTADILINERIAKALEQQQEPKDQQER